MKAKINVCFVSNKVSPAPLSHWLVCPNDPKIYADDSTATGIVSLVGQVKGAGPGQVRQNPIALWVHWGQTK